MITIEALRDAMRGLAVGSQGEDLCWCGYPDSHHTPACTLARKALAHAPEPMRIKFRDRVAGPERLVCEAEIVFDEPGPLQGMKLVGFCLWRGPEGDAGPDYVTFPSRAFGGGNDRRFFDYLRGGSEDAEANRTATSAVKAWILEQYKQREIVAGIRRVEAANHRECADCGRPAHDGACAAQARANKAHRS